MLRAPRRHRVGFALARGPAEILAIFGALGAGLAAPHLLGTDAEAAGTPPAPGTVGAARRTERTGPAVPGHAFDHGGKRLGRRLLGVLLLAVALAGLALWMSFS